MLNKTWSNRSACRSYLSISHPPIPEVRTVVKKVRQGNKRPPPPSEVKLSLHHITHPRYSSPKQCRESSLRLVFTRICHLDILHEINRITVHWYESIKRKGATYSPIVPSSRIRVPIHLFSAKAPFAYLQMKPCKQGIVSKQQYKCVCEQDTETPTV